MASVHTKVKKYLEANSKTDAELYNGNVVLADDGDGVVYIKTWNVDGVTKPTDSQIASYETTGNEEEALTKILVKRKKEYLSWNEQLDWRILKKETTLPAPTPIINKLEYE